jgi:hypothetical protein
VESGATAAAAAAALHGSLHASASSSVKAVGKALHPAVAAAALAASGPSLRSGDYNDVDVAVLASQHGLAKVAAVVGAGLASHWQGSLQSAAAKSPRAAQGSRDTVQSADCSPRQASQTSNAAAAVAAAAAAMQGAVGQLINGMPAALAPDMDAKGAAAGSARSSAQNSSRTLKHGIEAETPGLSSSISMKQQAMSLLTSDASQLHGQHQHINGDGHVTGIAGSNRATTKFDKSSSLVKAPVTQIIVNDSSAGLASCLPDGMNSIALAAAEQVFAAQQQQQLRSGAAPGHGKLVRQTQQQEQFAPASLLEKLLPRLHHR